MQYISGKFQQRGSEHVYIGLHFMHSMQFFMQIDIHTDKVLKLMSLLTDDDRYELTLPLFYTKDYIALLTEWSIPATLSQVN